MKKRPRVPSEQKRRRGSATIKLKGAGLLASELSRMAPLLRQRFVDAMNGSLAVIGMDMARGGDLTAHIEVKRSGDGTKVYEVRRLRRPLLLDGAGRIPQRIVGSKCISWPVEQDKPCHGRLRALPDMRPGRIELKEMAS